MIVEIPVARRAAIHAALADPHRLEIVDELVLSERSPSELGERLRMGSNLLAHHLRILEDAGVVERLPSAGDRRRRYVRLVPESLGAISAPATVVVARHVLFVCTENSARSQLAAAAWNARHEVPASSAGTHPAAAARREAVAAAARAGLDLSAARPRALGDVSEPVDVVVTVCDIAHEELGERSRDVPTFHWSIPDPARSRSASAYDEAVRRIRARVETLAPRVRPRRRPRRSRP
ncbi:MAG TPA: helix-turn-helix domain-containing protein [Actinomycetota bacterium]|nr:helix-turn-helix domain-containing protein [Actinomycetota bacterium]